MPTAFVTGASGFVGTNLVRELLQRQWRVRVLVRGAAANLDGLAVDRYAGDLFRNDLAAIMRGSDVVFHVAALYSLWRRDADAVMRTNVAGTRSVLRAAREARVARVVYTSSVAAIGVAPGGVPADESLHTAPHALTGAYKQSKGLAEAVAREAAGRGQDIVIVNPSTPVGPYDVKPTPTGEIIVRFLRGRMPAYVDTGLNLVDVRDVATGHLLAYERGRSGERYILGAENLTLRDLLRRAAAIAGRPAPVLRIPRELAMVYAGVGELLLAPLGVRPDAPLDGVRMAKDHMYYDATRARAELGFVPKSIDEALRDAIAWFRANGYAPA